MAADRCDLHKHDLETTFPRIAEVPFDSDRKQMTTIHSSNASGALSALPPSTYISSFTKGAVGSLLEVASHVWERDRAVVLNRDWRDRINAANNHMAQTGIRVLGVAFRQWDTLPETIEPNSVEQNLVFIELIGMSDPPRAEVKPAIEMCWSAGIRPLMITGDHPLIGQHIAQELGMTSNT